MFSLYEPPTAESPYVLQDHTASAALVLETLLREHYAGVYRLISLFEDDEPRARKTARETFLAAIQKRERYQGQAGVAAWLYHLTLNISRAPKARTPEDSPRPEGLAGLPRALRLPLLLHALDGLSLHDIAHALGIRESRVKTRLLRARRALLPPQPAAVGRAHAKARREIDEALLAADEASLTDFLEDHLITCADCRLYAEQARTRELELRRAVEAAFPAPAPGPAELRALAQDILDHREVARSLALPKIPAELLWVGALLGVVFILIGAFSFSRNAGAGTSFFPTATPAGGPVAEPGSGEAPAISADGRWVAFASQSGRFVAGDTNGLADIFLYDQETGEMRRVSMALGAQANGPSEAPSISADGQRVAFVSDADNLAAGAYAACPEPGVSGQSWCAARGNIFLFAAGTVRRLTEGLGGAAPDGESFAPAISPDGQFVAFWSEAGNLVEGGEAGCGQANCVDLYLLDVEGGALVRLPVGRARGADAGTFALSLSEGGRWLAFTALASDRLAETLGLAQAAEAVVYDREEGTYALLDRAPGGEAGDGPSFVPVLSPDGRFAAFASGAANLVQGDTNREIDVFVLDRETGVLTRVSVGPAGEQADGPSGVLAARSLPAGTRLALSADGGRVAFLSGAANLSGRARPWWCAWAAIDAGVCSFVGMWDSLSGTVVLPEAEFSPNSRFLFPGLSSSGRWLVYMETIVDCAGACGEAWLWDMEAGQGRVIWR